LIRAERLLGGCLFALASALAAPEAGRADEQGPVDTALVLAVDVSGSVDPERYALQMQGIASAFIDAEVETNILAGRHHAMLVALVQWSDKPVVTIPWRRIASEDDATAFADAVRRAPRTAEEFTCMSRALHMIADKLLPLMPTETERTVIDVSGDGSDNCNPREKVDAVRDQLAAEHVTINGLPILEGDEADTLAAWYTAHVIGGPGAFIQPAAGFDDVGRAMRNKFALEISGLDATKRVAAVDNHSLR
jgi:hypothetical protein